MRSSFIHTLYFKLAFGLAGILLVVGVSYTILASYMVHQINLTSQQLINKDLALKLVKDNRIVHNGIIDKPVMKDTFMQYMMINPSIEIYFLDLQGRILAYSADPGKVKRNAVNLSPILEQLKNHNQQNILGDDPRTQNSSKAFSVTTIPNAENPEGYLYVMLQSEELTQALEMQSQNTIIYLSGIVLGGSLLIGLLTGLFLFYRIHRRLKKLQTNVAEFVDSDFSIEPFDDFKDARLLLKDEISELENHVIHMALHIKQQLSALKQQDSLRREMVANISHDLRTPLASIQGYLETLSVKYNDLSDNDKQNYIATAVKQAGGLQKLIDGLFELAKLDAQEHKLDLESFPLLELVYDVIAKFEMKADQKQIQLKIVTESDNPVVYADLGLIERVLDNLINNAIYYSHDNSTITINISSAEQGSLIVKVIDTGLGIAEDQKALVFERFHQAHTPEREDGHAGLGLCIVKKIIELHKQKIWVESTLNKGSQFNFTLSSA